MTTWRGWEAYDANVPAASASLRRAARSLVDIPGVRRDLATMLPNGAKGQAKGSIAMIVRSVVGVRANRGVLGRPLVGIYRKGWKAGKTAAEHAMTVRKDDRAQPVAAPPSVPPLTLLPAAPKITTHTDWPNWQPGNADQAAAGQTLEDLIRDAVGSDQGWATRAGDRGSLLASIEDNRLSSLVDAVAQALADGTSVDDLGGTLEGVLDDPAWADMVATTELARSMTSASMTSYLDGNVSTVIWLAADDDRECPLCQANESQGEIPLGGDWINGPPPVHPRCRCALAPGSFGAGATDEG